VAAADVARTIEQSLLARGVVLQPDGGKFVVAVPNGLAYEKVPSQLEEAREVAATIEKTRKAAASRATGEQHPPDMFVPGTINFPNTDLNQVLTIYAELTDRTIIRPATLPAPTVSFKNYTALTREEAIYAMTAVFALNGISVSAAGDKLLVVVPAAQKEEVPALLLQKGPLDYSFGTNVISAGSIIINSDKLDQIATVYGQLAGRQVEVGSSARISWYRLRTQTAMTSGEALRALDLLLGLQRLKVVQSDTHGTLKIVDQSENNP